MLGGLPGISTVMNQRAGLRCPQPESGREDGEARVPAQRQRREPLGFIGMYEAPAVPRF